MTDSTVSSATYTIGSPFDPSNPAKEYIRLGGRPIAIENQNH